MTETSAAALINVPGQNKPGTVGRLISGTTAMLIDENGQDVPIGEPGQLWLKGRNIMKGYIGNPKATAEDLTADGWLKTGEFIEFQMPLWIVLVC